MKATRSHWDEQDTLPASSSAFAPDPASIDPVDAGEVTDMVLSGQTPPRRRAGDSFLQSLMRFWPRDGGEPRDGAQARAMAELRTVFRASLTDLIDLARIQQDSATEQRLLGLLRHIVHARHPQDLWHLRAAIYTEVARAHDQGEAERRLNALNQRLHSRRGLLRRLLGGG